MTPAKANTTLRDLHSQWLALFESYNQQQQNCDETWNDSPTWYRSPTLSRADTDRICISIEQEMRPKFGASRAIALSSIIRSLLNEETALHAKRCAQWESESSFSSQTDTTNETREHLDELTQTLIRAPIRNTDDLKLKFDIVRQELAAYRNTADLPVGIMEIIDELALETS